MRHTTTLRFLLTTAAALLSARLDAAPAAVAITPPTPAWWSMVPIRTLAATNAPADHGGFWRALLAVNLPLDGVTVTNWQVIGPFDGLQGKGFDTVYPPEEALRKDTFKGKGGAKVTWQAWAPGAPCPLAGDRRDSVMYGATVHAFDAVEGCLLVTADDRCRVWLDGTVVLADSGARNAVNIVPIRAAPGPRKLLVKVYQSPYGSGAFRVGWSKVDPRLLEIKLRSYLVNRLPEEEQRTLANTERLIGLSLEVRDAATFSFWTSLYLNGIWDANRMHNTLTWVVPAVTNPPLNPEDLSGLLQRALIRRTGTNDNCRAVLAERLADLACLAKNPAGPVAAMRKAGTLPSAAASRRVLALYGPGASRDELPFWLETYCQQESDDGKLALFIGEFVAWAPDLNHPAMCDALDRALGRATTPDRQLRLARRFAELVLAQGDSTRLRAFLKAHAALLQSLAPWDKAVWQLRLSLLDRDQDAAREALKAAAELKPGYESSAEYTAYLYQIHMMHSVGTQPSSVDTSTEIVASEARKIAHSGSSDELCRFIRDTLPRKAGVTVSNPEDADLFTGGKSVYRGLFAEYGTAYESYLAGYIAQLERQPTDELRKAARQLRRTAGLAAPPPAEPAPSSLRPSGLTSGKVKGFRPLAALPPGVPEWSGEGGRCWLNGSAEADFNGVTVYGENVIVQNSRAVVCVRQGRVAWTRASPLGSAWTWDPNQQPLYLGGRLVPAAAGNVAVVRLFDWAGRNTLVGISLADGRLLWQWPVDAGEPVSNPAFWGTDRVTMLASRSEGQPQGQHAVDVVVLDALSGAVLYRLPLCVGWRDLAIAPYRAMQHYQHCPAPVVEGNIAYVDTGAGIVGAIDLADESILWLRAYTRKFDPSALGSRMPAAPVVGPANVLFAPFDASLLLLLDKKTGRLAARRTDLAWTTMAPCGGKAASVLTANTALFLDLERLNETGRLTGHDLRLAAVCAEGTLIQSGDGAALCNAAGKALAKLQLPPGVQPLAAADGNLYAAAYGPAFDQFGLVTGDREAATAPVVASVPPGPGFVPFTRAIPMPRGGLVVNGPILTRLDDSGRRLWERPIELENLVYSPYRVVSDGRTVTILRAGRAWLFDEATGALQAVWPSGEVSATNRVLCLSACGGATYGVLSSPEPNRAILARLTVDAPPAPIGPPLPAVAEVYTTIGWTRMKDFFVSVAPDGKSAAGVFLSGSILAFGKASSAPADKEPAWVQVAGVNTLCTDAMRSQGFAVRDSDLKQWRFSGGGMEETTVKLPASATGWQSSRSGDLISFANSKDQILYDPPSGNSFSVRNARLCYTVGTRVFGVMNPPKHTLAPGADFPPPNVRYAATNGTPFRLDLRAGATPQTASDMPVPGNIPGSGAVRAGQTCAAILGSWFRPGNADWAGGAFSWDDRSPAPVWTLFPRLPNGTRVSQVGDSLVAINACVLTEDELRACMSLPKRIHTRSGVATRPMPQMDGFLDEWKDEEFMPAAQGRLAVRLFRGGGWAPMDVCLAAEITDPALIARLMAGGLDGKLELSVCTGYEASFFMDCGGYDPFLLRFPGKQARGSSAWSVTADGRSLRIETYLPCTGNGPWFHFAAGAEPSNPYRDFGDLAVRLRWVPDPFTPPVNLLGEKPAGPLSVERILFQAPAAK